MKSHQDPKSLLSQQLERLYSFAGVPLEVATRWDFPSRAYTAKKSGIYFVRLLTGTLRKYSESRLSLRTKDASQARKIVAALSMFIEGIPMAHRKSAFDDFHRSINFWTIGNVSVKDDHDQNRLSRFLAELDSRPSGKATFLAILDRPHNLTAAISGCTRPLSESLLPDSAANQTPIAICVPALAPCVNDPVPKNPMRFSAALQLFREHALKNKATVPRTVNDRHDFLQKLGQFVTGTNERLDKDPWVHQIHTHHLGGFMNTSAERHGRQDFKIARGSLEPMQVHDGDEKVETLKAGSLLKLCFGFRHQFRGLDGARCSSCFHPGYSPRQLSSPMGPRLDKPTGPPEFRCGEFQNVA